MRSSRRSFLQSAGIAAVGLTQTSNALTKQDEAASKSLPEPIAKLKSRKAEAKPITGDERRQRLERADDREQRAGQHRGPPVGCRVQRNRRRRLLRHERGLGPRPGRRRHRDGCEGDSRALRRRRDPAADAGAGGRNREIRRRMDALQDGGRRTRALINELPRGSKTVVYPQRAWARKKPCATYFRKA